MHRADEWGGGDTVCVFVVPSKRHIARKCHAWGLFSSRHTHAHQKTSTCCSYGVFSVDRGVQFDSEQRNTNNYIRNIDLSLLLSLFFFFFFIVFVFLYFFLLLFFFFLFLLLTLLFILVLSLLLLVVVVVVLLCSSCIEILCHIVISL